eukprot:XP_001695902.1 predicted protein [Chlamydomonas reinhardtii]
MLWGCGDVGLQSEQDGEMSSSILKALQLLSNQINELSGKVDNVAQKVDNVAQKVDNVAQKVDNVAQKVDNVAAGLDDMRRFQGTMVEMVTLTHLPARLEGCERVWFEADADLDAVFGRGTAAAVLGAVAHPSGGRMLRTRLLCRLLLAVRRDLDDSISLPLQSSGKGAAAVQAVLDTLRPEPAGQDRRRAGKKQQRQQEPQLPPGAVADAEALLAAFKALLVLFLLTTGRLRAELEVDLMRLRPRTVGPLLFGRPELLVGEIKSDLSELGPARRQLEIALAVLELACRFSPYYGGGGVLRGLLAPYSSRSQPPSLDARAVVCGGPEGRASRALAARQGLLGDLQVQLVADLDLDPDLDPDPVIAAS